SGLCSWSTLVNPHACLHIVVRSSVHGSGSVKGNDRFLDDNDDDDDFPMDMPLAFLIAFIALKETADNNYCHATRMPLAGSYPQLSVTVPAVIASVKMEVEEKVEVRPCGMAGAAADVFITIEEAVLSPEPQGTAAALSNSLTANEDSGDTIEPALDGGKSSIVEQEDTVGIESEETVMLQTSTTCLDWSNDADLEVEHDSNIRASATLVVSSTTAPIVDVTSRGSQKQLSRNPSVKPIATRQYAFVVDEGGRRKMGNQVAPMSAPLATPDYSAVMNAREEWDKVNRAIWQARQGEKAAAGARKEEEKRRHKDKMRRREEEKKQQLNEATAQVKRALEEARMEVQLAVVKAEVGSLLRSPARLLFRTRTRRPIGLRRSQRTTGQKVEPISGSVEEENAEDGQTDQAEMNKGLNDIPESESPLPSDSDPHPCEAAPVDNADRPMVELEEAVLLVEENKSSPEPSLLASSEWCVTRNDSSTSVKAIWPVEPSSSTAVLPIDETEEEVPEGKFVERTDKEQAPLELSAIQIEETPDDEDIVEQSGGDRVILCLRSLSGPQMMPPVRRLEKVEDVGVGEVDPSECINAEILPEESVKFDKGKDQAILSSLEPPSTTEMKGVFEAPFDALLEQPRTRCLLRGSQLETMQSHDAKALGF
ncbi:hypothetical protein DXG01_015746, partial [Tephrocybe rancida]